MKIGIFGGTFNPPHKMHLRIALSLIEKNYVDKVIFVPTGNKYDRKDLNNEIDRLNMVDIMIKNYKNLESSDFELGKKRVYTYQTLNHFKETYKNDEIYFICGADNINDFKTWKNYQYILDNFKVLVIARNNEKVGINHPNIIFTDVITDDLSSTFIRKNIKTIKNIANLIDENVLDYIKERKFYEGSC